MGSPSLLQGIFPIQGSNPGLPQGRWTLHSWATREAPYSYTKGQTSVVQSSVQLRDPIYCSSPGFWPSPSSLGVCSNSGPLSKGSMQSSCPRIDSWWWTGKPSAAVHGTAVKTQLNELSSKANKAFPALISRRASESIWKCSLQEFYFSKPEQHYFPQKIIKNRNMVLPLHKHTQMAPNAENLLRHVNYFSHVPCHYIDWKGNSKYPTWLSMREFHIPPISTWLRPSTVTITSPWEFWGLEYLEARFCAWYLKKPWPTLMGMYKSPTA